jgi:hypothetical protein
MRTWYSAGNRISLLCFISERFFGKNHGFNHAMARLQKAHPEISCGVAAFPISADQLLQLDNKVPKSESVMALGKYEQMHPGNFIIQNHRMFSCRIIDQKRRAFCSISLENINDSQDLKLFIFAKALKLIMIIAFISFVYQKKQQLNFIPIRIKLTVLFLYAGGIPLLIGIIIAADYLQQKRSELTYRHQSEILAWLREKDEGFNGFLRAKENSFNELVKKYKKIQPLFHRDQKLLQTLGKELVNCLQPGSLMFINRNGKNLLQENYHDIFSDSTILGQLTGETLRFMNHSDTSEVRLSEVTRSFASEVIFAKEKILDIALGEHKTYACYHLLGNTENYETDGILFAFWNFEYLQMLYLQELARKNSRIVAYFPRTDTFLGSEVSWRNNDMGRLVQKAEKLLVTRKESIRQGNSLFTAAAMRGANLNQAVLAGLVSVDIIDREISQMRNRFLFYAGVFLTIVLGAILIIRRRLLSPLHDFKTAIESIGHRNFRYKTSIEGTNEFGTLGKALNRTLENLQELEVARIVQENLIPGREFSCNGLRLHADFQPMSHIGGDYYDFFAVDSSVAGIFIGDVSGHGISSALFMAMAKAAIIFANFTTPDQKAIMSSLNRIINANRMSGGKEYMTGLSLNVNSVSGDFSLINAGQCPPVILRYRSRQAEIVKCGGLPLGFRADMDFNPVTGRIEPGDFVILHTDGWLEAESDCGKIFGYDGFIEALWACCDRDLEIFSLKMFDSISKWQSRRNDDLTLIIIHFEKHHEISN